MKKIELLYHKSKVFRYLLQSEHWRHDSILDDLMYPLRCLLAPIYKLYLNVRYVWGKYHYVKQIFDSRLDYEWLYCKDIIYHNSHSKISYISNGITKRPNYDYRPDIPLPEIMYEHLVHLEGRGVRDIYIISKEEAEKMAEYWRMLWELRK